MYCCTGGCLGDAKCHTLLWMICSRTSGKGEKAQKGMGFGYTVAVTLDPIAAGNGRGTGAFGWDGAALVRT